MARLAILRGPKASGYVNWVPSDSLEETMADKYTCSCGNQTWQILDDVVRCTACWTDFAAPHMPVGAFNRMVVLELQEVFEE